MAVSSPSPSSSVFVPSGSFNSTIAQGTSDTLMELRDPLLKALDGAVINLVKDYGLPIDNAAQCLADFLGARFYKRGILLKNHGFSVDESSVNFAEFYTSFCRDCEVQVGDDEEYPMMQNALLLLKESCKFVSKKLQGDALLGQLDEYEFKAMRACIELEEMDKEISGRPVVMRAYANQELKEVEGWFQRLLNEWKQISLDLIIERLTETEKVFHELLSAQSSSAPDVATTVHNALAKLNDDLGKHPVFRGFLSVKRDHVAQVASTVEGEPASWLNLFSMPPVFKVSSFMKKFTGQKQALAAVSYSFRRRRKEPSNGRKPLRSFLVVDPSGQNWEEFASALSEILFDTSDVSLRISLSEFVGSTSGDMGKLFEGVRRRPYSVVIFEKVDQANDPAVHILNKILRTGYASDEGGTRVDFTKSVILIILQRISPFIVAPCPCIRILQEFPFKSYLGATSSSCGAKRRCRCVAVLEEASKLVDPKTWKLVDDVALFGSQFPSYVAAYARCILREMAGGYFHGRAILYPSEAALRNIHDEGYAYGETPVKSWLETHVRPVIDNLVSNGSISENSVILVDSYVGANELSYMIENREDHCRGAPAKKFKNWAADIRRAYEMGKYFEERIDYLIGKSYSFLREVSLSGSETISVREAIVDLISTTREALSAAGYLKSLKDALGSPVGKTDGMDGLGKRLKTTHDALCSGKGNGSAWPEIITTVESVLNVCRCSAASFLLLGLRDDGKKELVNGLASNIATAANDTVKIFAMDMSEYSDESALARLKNFPLSENLNFVEAVRKHPCSIFYFDKIEKAHITVYGWLLSLLRCGVLTDDQGSEVDFRRTVLIFGSDCGNKCALAKLAGDNSTVDSTSEAGSGQEKEGSKACRFRFELLCKVDKLMVFSPFAAHQLRSMGSYEVEDLRRCITGIDFKEWFSFFPILFLEGDVPKMAEKWLESARPRKKLLAQQCSQSPEWLTGWLPSVLPDPYLYSYQSVLSELPFV